MSIKRECKWTVFYEFLESGVSAFKTAMFPPTKNVHDVYLDFNRFMQVDHKPDKYNIKRIEKGNPGTSSVHDGGGVTYDEFNGRKVEQADGKKAMRKWK